jgi:low affinity Fe/Cu permease
MAFNRLNGAQPGWSFRKIAAITALAVGTAPAFFIAFGIVVVWAVTGPLFHFSDTWQLVINTGTTIVTFLMVFLIQNQQNRDADALHVKLDALVSAMEGAPNKLVGIEHKDEPLDTIRDEIEREAEAAGDLTAAPTGGRKGSDRRPIRSANGRAD